MSQGPELTGDGHPPTSEDVASLSFEEAFRRLGEMAESLEQGSLTLAEATARYKEGMELVRRCNQLLNEADLKISSLQGSHATNQDDDAWAQED